MAAGLLAARDGAQQIEDAARGDLVNEFGAEVFAIDQDQRFALSIGLEYLADHFEQPGRGLRGGARRRADSKSQGLAGVGVETEKSLGHLDGLPLVFVLAPRHLAFGVRAHPVRIDGQELAGEVAAGAAQLAEGHFQRLRLFDGVGCKQGVDGLIRGDEGQAVGQLESLLSQAAPPAQTGHAQRGLAHQLQGQARLDALRAFSGPAAQQVPRAEAQMLGDEESQAGVRARDLVSQQLADAALEGGRVGRIAAAGRFRALRQDRLGRRGSGLVEVFF